jgi:hypothetical protein
MLWAFLAAYLTKRPAWVQALVVGLCTGLFVAAAAEANQRDPLINSVILLVLVTGAAAGTAFYLALRAQRRHGWRAGTTAPAVVHLVSRLRLGVGAIAPCGAPGATRRWRSQDGRTRDRPDRTTSPTRHRRNPNAAAALPNTEGGRTADYSTLRLRTRSKMG